MTYRNNICNAISHIKNDCDRSIKKPCTFLTQHTDFFYPAMLLVETLLLRDSEERPLREPRKDCLSVSDG